ncbi:MAG: hypothetical protein ACFB0D_23370 [Phormidesmis sp.]
MLFNIFTAWWRKIQQDPAGWGILLLFAVGLIVLLSIMRLMPYTN